MKISVSTYSFKNYISSLGIRGCLEKLKEYGADGVDFAVFHSLEYDDYLNFAREAGEHARALGLEVSCCTGHLDFLTGSGGDLKEEIQAGYRQVELTRAYGGKTMRYDLTNGYPRSVTTKRSYDCILPRIAQGAREVAKYAQQFGITTSTENHGFFSQDSDRMEKVINEVGMDSFGALIDMGNFLCADEDPAKAVGILAPYAKHVHAKDFYFRSGMLDHPGEGWFMTRGGNYLKGAIIGHGVVPVRQCINILKAAGYNGFLGIEFEGMEDALTGIRIGINNLRALL